MYTQSSSSHSAPGQMPAMKPAGGGIKPASASILVMEDLTGSAVEWAEAIRNVTRQLVPRLESALASVTWGYRGCRDIDVGESDEQRLVEGSGADLLREQAAGKREGGGDADETFADSLEYALESYTFSPLREASKGVVLFQTSSTKPARSGRSLEEIGALFKQRRIRLFVVGTPGSNLERVTDAAGDHGFFIELTAKPNGVESEAVAKVLLATMKGTLSQAGKTDVMATMAVA